MLSLAAKLVPLFLLMPLPPPAPGGSVGARPGLVSGAAVPARTLSGRAFPVGAENRHQDIAHQVQIEQRLQIRIIARPGPIPFDVMIDESRPSGPRYIEAKVGKCIAANNFAAMQVGSGRRIFLFTRDNRIFTGVLERNCEARDYYSGFYIARAADAKLCAERDRLLSRSGANCRLKQIRELIEVGD